MRKRLATDGVDITQLPTWSSIDELRLVANTVRHADGASADELKARRPEFFEYDHANGKMTPMPFPSVPRVYPPMSGEDLYLAMDDLGAHGRATINFWDKFSDALESVR